MALTAKQQRFVDEYLRRLSRKLVVMSLSIRYSLVFARGCSYGLEYVLGKH